MPQIEVYMRIIERFGAAGALLASNMAVVLKFPQGDRKSTQITPHDVLIELVREAAPPHALDEIDRNQSSQFEIISGNALYMISVQPQRGSWQVHIDPAAMPAQPDRPAAQLSALGSEPKNRRTTNTSPSSGIPVVQQPAKASGSTRSHDSQPVRAPGSQPVRAPMDDAPANRRTIGSVSAVVPAPDFEDDEQRMVVERGQYEQERTTITSSGSALLDQLTAGARASKASDVYLTAGSAPFMRVNGQLMSTAIRFAIDADLLSRELGIIAPADIRTNWLETGVATFTYGDGLGRVRARLTRDHRGPAASLRLLAGEPPTLEELGLYEVDNLLEDRGLILVGGPSGSGKSTTLAAMIRALGDDRRSVVVLEDAIEFVHVCPWISQRRIGEHVPDIRTGVDAAMAEGVDAIVISAARDSEHALAVIEAATGGHLVITTVVSPVAEVAVDRLIDRLPEAARAGAREVVTRMLLGAVAPILGHDGERTFEVVFGSRRNG